MAIFLWSMSFSVLGFGQTLTHDGSTPTNFDLDVTTLSITGPSWHRPDADVVPFFWTFMIYGDGNFELFETKIKNNFSFSHPYQYNTNGSANDSYPYLALLLERKTDTPPPSGGYFLPSAGAFPIPPPPYPPFGPSSPVPADISTSSPFPGFAPPPLIILNPNNKLTDGVGEVATGYSHWYRKDGLLKKYLEEDKIVAFPIGYKPFVDGRRDFLVFYYDDDLNLLDEFNDLSMAGFPLSYGAIDPPHFDVKNNISEMQSTNAFTSNFNQFEKMLVYEVDANYEKFNINSPGSPSELRWFPLLKSNDLLNASYKFLAVLYGDIKSGDLYNLKKGILGGGSEIPEYYIDTATHENFGFRDANLFTVQAHEPEDPNKLKIIKICKCGIDNYKITFDLEYCNEAEFEKATGATIVLEDNPDCILDCFEFIGSDRGIECTLGEACNSDRPCNQKFTLINPEDKKFCVEVVLAADPPYERCDHIQFSAIIHSANINLLWQQSILDYCVILHPWTSGVADEGITADEPPPKGSLEECNSNCLLETLIVVDTTIFDTINDNTILPHTFSKLIPNEVWEDKDLECEDQPNCCLDIVPKGGGANYWAIAAIVILFGFVAFTVYKVITIEDQIKKITLINNEEGIT